MKSNEILEVVDSVSTEKGLDKDLIFKAIEIAIASASQRHFHEDADLFVKVNRQTGEYSTHRNWLVFDKDDEEFHHETHISSDDSKLNIGEIFSSEQENITFGRIETQAARQVMLQKVREAEREKVVEQFKSQNNKLVSGSVAIVYVQCSGGMDVAAAVSTGSDALGTAWRMASSRASSASRLCSAAR